jgi:small-conductance mechanosensitive channel
MNSVIEWFKGIEGTQGLVQVVVIVGALLLALLVRMLFARVFLMFTRKTSSELDDQIVAALRRPVVLSILLAGIAFSVSETPRSEAVDYVVMGLIISLAALVWATAILRVGHLILEVVSRRVDQLPWIQPKTLPLFDMLLKVVVVGGFLYFICIAWGIPLTSWLTSAGIVGIAVGFAAKDTLSNLFSGIFIIADAPYKLGDYVNLDNNVRGIVTEIGIRSTRVLTRDDIEVTVPNAVIANALIVNETGGPYDKMRVRVKVGAAYGSDIDQVEEVLLGCVEGVEHVSPKPAPRVRFREFGASSLDFELLAWIEEPVYRGLVRHELHRRVYKAFDAAGIEIPYAKQDVYVKELPPPARPSDDV